VDSGSIELDRTPQRARRHILRTTGAALIASFFLAAAFASTAFANPVERRVRWYHLQHTQVASFLIAVTDDPWNPAATRYIDAGLPVRMSEAYTFDISVEAGEWVSVIAVGFAGQRSSGTPWLEVSTVPVSAPGEPIFDPTTP